MIVPQEENTFLQEMKAFLLTPAKRCFVTLGLACLGLFIVTAYVGFQSPYGYNRPGFILCFVALHLPLSMFFPLFFVARSWALTPVTISLAFSMSMGLLLMSFRTLVPFLYGAGGAEVEMVMMLDMFCLGFWWFFSFFQAGTFSTYGFSSSLPTLYIIGGPIAAVIGMEMPGVALSFGFLYFLVAGRGLNRVYHAQGRKIELALSGKPAKKLPTPAVPLSPGLGSVQKPGNRSEPPGSS